MTERERTEDEAGETQQPSETPAEGGDQPQTEPSDAPAEQQPEGQQPEGEPATDNS